MRHAFVIKLHKKDKSLLELIKNTLGVGHISSFNTEEAIQFRVESFKELQVIIDHFDKYPLITKKHCDYLIFINCFEIIKKREHLTEKGLLKILGLKSYLNLGLSDKLKEAFPNIIPENKPEYKFKGISDPFWIAGFSSGDGCFHILVSEQKSKITNTVLRKVVLRFSIKWHIREEEVIKGMVNYLKSIMVDQFSDYLKETKKEIKKKIYKHYYKSEKDNSVGIILAKFSDIEFIIPFFEKYPILGQKSLDFEDFKKVAKLVKIKKPFNTWWL